MSRARRLIAIRLTAIRTCLLVAAALLALASVFDLQASASRVSHAHRSSVRAVARKPAPGTPRTRCAILQRAAGRRSSNSPKRSAVSAPGPKSTSAPEPKATSTGGVEATSAQSRKARPLGRVCAKKRPAARPRQGASSIGPSSSQPLASNPSPAPQGSGATGQSESRPPANRRRNTHRAARPRNRCRAGHLNR
jgi:hypothetical protein